MCSICLERQNVFESAQDIRHHVITWVCRRISPNTFRLRKRECSGRTDRRVRLYQALWRISEAHTQAQIRQNRTSSDEMSDCVFRSFLLIKSTIACCFLSMIWTCVWYDLLSSCKRCLCLVIFSLDDMHNCVEFQGSWVQNPCRYNKWGDTIVSLVKGESLGQVGGQLSLTSCKSLNFVYAHCDCQSICASDQSQCVRLVSAIEALHCLPGLACPLLTRSALSRCVQHHWPYGRWIRMCVDGICLFDRASNASSPACLACPSQPQIAAFLFVPCQ